MQRQAFGASGVWLEGSDGLLTVGAGAQERRLPELAELRGSAAAWERTRENHEEDVDYCGPSDSDPRAVSYFLRKWQACGRVTATEQGALAVRCFTW
jgi:hypothetical protein